MQILVLGAGVIGLTSAIELQEAGHDVTVRAPERTPGTTSDVAAAVHYPFMAEPRDKVLAWSKVSLDVFGEQADEPGTGVRIDDLLEVFDDPPPEPWWGEAVVSIRQASQAELPQGYGGGLISTVPFIDMAIYMPHLEDRFQAAGGTFEQGAVGSLGELAGQGWEVVVNATGMGARELVDDDRLTPVRGQVVHVDAPDFGKGIVDQQRDAQLAYVVPMEDRVVLGGTAEEGETDRTPSQHATDVILARCRRLAPDLEGGQILEVKVGLRPIRDEVRLEREVLDSGLVVVHNYGHGGAGVTLSWGCAREVVALAEGQR